MLNNRLSILLVSFIFTACEPVDEESKKATLKNNLWIATTCSTTVATDSNGVKHYFYYKGLYRFDNDNTVKIGRNNYKDSACTQFLENHAPASPENLTYNFYDLGKSATVKDYSIYDLKVEKVGESSQSVDALYAISKNELCLSASLYANNSYLDTDDNKTYESMVLDVYPDNNASQIDYGNCLGLIGRSK